MTKSEQIRNMTDDQLATEVNSLMAIMCRHYCKGCKQSKYNCFSAIKKYLSETVPEATS